MNHTFTITLPTDGQGYVGRLCPSCNRYFKIKPGTGLPTQSCQCPYCQNVGGSSDFITPEQEQYVRSMGKKIAYEKIVFPMLDDFSRSLKRLEHSSSKSFIKIKVSSTRSHPHFPINYYSEKDLETEVICDACELQFAVYGVFASCPDCAKINAYTIFRKSLEVSKKKLEFILQHQEVARDFLDRELKEILSDTVSSFDGLGKALQEKYPALAPKKIKNLFQKIDVLDGVFENMTGVKLSVTHSNLQFLLKMFQVRHIYIHNMGVVDEDYIKKVPQDSHLLGRKYPLKREEVDSFSQGMEELVTIIEGVLTP